MEKIVFTEKGKNYWNDEGQFQADSERLYKKYIPASGEPENEEAKPLWAINRLYYDWCNNGNCNVSDTTFDNCDQCGGDGLSGSTETEECWECGGDGVSDDEKCDTCEGKGEIDEDCDCEWCGGSGQEEGDVVINEYYSDMIKHLKDYFKDDEDAKKSVVNLENFILSDSDNDFTDEDYQIYDRVMDYVLFYAKNRLD